MRDSLATAAALLLLSACHTSEGPRPQDVPARREIVPAGAEVLGVTFEADAAGYRVVGVQRTLGAPTSGIVKDRDVRVTALDASGRTIATVSVANPRLVQTAGSRNPATATLDRVTFTVHFARPGDVDAVDVQVTGGPNSEFRGRFPIKR